MRFGAMLTVLAAFGAVCACSAPEAPAAVETPPRTVTVVVAAPAVANGEVQASATIRYLREPILSFRTPGVIEAIGVEEGDRVKAGQRLAWIRPTQVAADTAQAAAAAQVAQRNLDRQRALFERGFVSEARLDDAELALERAQAALAGAQFSEDTAEILAPANGVILQRLAEPNQVAGAGSAVLVMGETGSGLIARAAVPAASAARIRVGDDASVRAPDVRDAPFRGKVTRVAAGGDARTGAFDVDIDLPDAAGLVSGLVAEAIIVAKPSLSGEAPIALPTLALLDARTDQGSVFVVEGNVARRRLVRTAGIVGDEVLILAGVKPGDRVIAAGVAYVRDGDRVVARDEP